MFSSLSNSLSNLYNNASFSINLSPQAILASYLSASLAEFLQVDSHFIETSLLTDKHVKLHQIQLKPRTVRDGHNHASTITLTGTIQKIEFRWEWDTQTYISNVRLTIDGVDLRLSKENHIIETSVSEQDIAKNDSTLPGTAPESNGNTDWKAVYMQQIIDHLSVSISDVQITIGLENKDLIVLGSGIDLTTKEQQKQENSDDSPSLMQLMSLQSLSAYFEEPNREQIQLLGAFGYSASVHRVSGRRFVDRIMNGLVITGHPQESIQWYMGAVQVDGLLQLLQLLRVVEPEIDMSLPEPTYSYGDRSVSSVFELPLPSMSVLMEENMNVLFKDGLLQYRTDGSECLLQLGRASAEIKEEQLAVLHNLTVDAINCSLLLRQPEDESDTVVVKLPLRTEMVKRFHKVCGAYGEVMRDKSHMESDAENVDSETSRNRPWSVDIQGTSKFEVSNELGWMQWSMDKISIFTKYGTSIPFNASWKCAHLTSSQGIIMDVSMMELLDDTFHLSGNMDVSITSMDAATQFSEFLNDAFSNYSGDESQSTELLCNIILPKINGVILEPGGGIHFECENLELEGAALTLRGRRVQISTALNGISSNYFSCHDFQTAFELGGARDDQTVKVKVINMCGIEYLSSVRVQSLYAEATIDPKNMNSISDVIITARDPVLTADFRSDKWSKQIESQTETDPILLPNANVSKMDVTLHFIGAGITLENAKIGLPEFQGNASTRSDTLATHYVKLVKKRLPFLLTKANVAGVNVGDTLSSGVATLAVQSSLVGTLVGVVGKDGVGAAITAGKATRGASESERYHFGDLSKGLAASARGASMSGAAAASSSYASENRVRLSSAAGSGVGMVAGLALAGPIGLIAGSILAGKAVGNAVEQRYGDPKNRTTSVTRQETSIDEDTPEQPTAVSSTDTSFPPNSAQQYIKATESSQPDFLTQTADPTAGSASSFFGNLPPTPISTKDGQESKIIDTARVATTSTVSQSGSGGSYKFGSITRGVIARGKAARGANKAEGYKFGDFTRGFLG